MIEAMERSRTGQPSSAKNVREVLDEKPGYQGKLLPQPPNW